MVAAGSSDGVAVEDVLPSSLSLSSWTADAGTYDVLAAFAGRGLRG